MKPSLVLKDCFWAFIFLEILFFETSWAQDSSYCLKVKARANADAALLVAPKIIIEGIHFPSSNRIDVGPTVGNNYQLRVGASYSPLDLIRGLRLLDMGDADCRKHDTSQSISDVLQEALDSGRLPAGRQQVAYLTSHQDRWRSHLAMAEKRMKAGVITAVEFHELRRYTEVLERKIEVARGDIARLEARGANRPPTNWHSLAVNYTASTELLEKKFSKLRSLDPWGFKFTGGIIPTPNKIDWFAIAEVNFNLGIFSHSQQEWAYLTARANEVNHAQYELPAHLEKLKKQLQAELNQAQQELSVVKTELNYVRKTILLLEKSDAPNMLHARATLSVEEFSLESDFIFLETLVNSLTTLIEVPHAS